MWLSSLVPLSGFWFVMFLSFVVNIAWLIFLGDAQHIPYPLHIFDEVYLGNEWETIQIGAAVQYFTPYELCGLQRRSKTARSACDEYPGKFPLAGCYMFQGGIGHVTGLCPNIFGPLYKHKNTAPWPLNHNIMSIMKSLRDSHQSNTIVLIGDSIASQHFYQTICILVRYGMQANISSQIYDRFLHVEVAYPGQPTNPFHIFFVPNVIQTTWPSIVDSIVDNTILRDSNVTYSHSGKILFIVNFGLHLHSANALTEISAKSFRYFTNLASKRKVSDLFIFRETSAQHFNTVDGSYPNDLKILKHPRKYQHDQFSRDDIFGTCSDDTPVPSHYNNSKAYTVYTYDPGCKAIRNAEAYDKQNWRNRQIIDIELPRHDPDRLFKVAEFYRITAPRYELHLSPTDCTHFCSGPMLWLPLWDNIGRIVANSTQN